MAQKVADIFIETLAAAGVKRIYGVVGDSLNGLTDVLRKQTTIEWVHVRHEEVAAFAAGAEAQLTGGIAVCAGSCGPGNLHLINGLFDCQRNRVPVLAFAAQVPSREIGSGYFQETNPQSLFKDCSHYCELVSQADQMPRVWASLCARPSQNAVSRWWCIPGDVALRECHGAALPLGIGHASPFVALCPLSYKKPRGIINGAQKVTILAARDVKARTPNCWPSPES